jgi:hypothetical protein
MATSRCRQVVRALVVAALVLCAFQARASFHLWKIDEVFSDASGTVQFIELTTSASGEQFLSGHGIAVMQGASTHTFNFTTNLPGDSANHHFLIATQGFADLGLVTPDYVVPNGFLFLPNATINYASVDVVTYPSLPSDGIHSIDHNGNVMLNSPTNFAGQSASVSPAPTSSAALENPQPGSFQSGIGLLSGWSCQGPSIGIAIDGAAPASVPYGSNRADTSAVCGATNINTGFGLLINFNLFGAGTHAAQMFVNGQAQGSPTSFTVTAPAGEFLTGAVKEVTVADFPTPGKTTVLIWQQSQQNFAIKSVSP